MLPQLRLLLLALRQLEEAPQLLLGLLQLLPQLRLRLQLVLRLFQLPAQLRQLDFQFFTALADFARQGIQPLQQGKYDDDWHVYLDTEARYGVVWELGNQGRIRPPQKRYPAE